MYGRFASRLGNLAGSGGGAASDEEAQEQASETMQGMVGNEGQRVIIEMGMDAFMEWAARAQEEPGAFDEWPGVIQEALSGGKEGKYEGTREIWDAGFQIIAQSSGIHDAGDEQGEGTGDNVTGRGQDDPE